MMEVKAVLEQFTEEQIAQIKKELQAREKQSQKQSVVGDQINRIEELFPKRVYSCDGNGLYATSEIKDSLLKICDHITNNYVVKTKWTRAHPGKHLVRAGVIPGEIVQRYHDAFADLVDVIEKWNVPLPEREKPEEKQDVDPMQRVVADGYDARQLIKLKPGVKPFRD